MARRRYARPCACSPCGDICVDLSCLCAGAINGAIANAQVIEVPSPILTLDWEELYTQSAWGEAGVR